MRLIIRYFAVSIAILIVSPCMCASLKGGGKSASDHVRENRMRRMKAKYENDLKNRRRYNSNKKIEIKGMAGYLFREKYEDAYMVKLDKPRFQRYTYVTLKNSPSVGLFSITLSTCDPIIRCGDDIKKEINRMVDVFCRRFGVSFTSELKVMRDTDNKVLVTHGNFSAVNTSHISPHNIHGQYNEISHVIGNVRAISYSLTENFSNCEVSFKGVHNMVDNTCRVDFCVELKTNHRCSTSTLDFD